MGNDVNIGIAAIVARIEMGIRGHHRLPVRQRWYGAGNKSVEPVEDGNLRNHGERCQSAGGRGQAIFEPDTGNNTASTTVTPQQSDLELFKTVSNATPEVGDTV